MKLIKKIFCIIALLALSNCSNDFLNLQPKDKIDANALFLDPEGIKAYMANLYFQLPIEDFLFSLWGYNIAFVPAHNGFVPAMQTDEAVSSITLSFQADGDFNWWTQLYQLISDNNLMAEVVPTLKISDADKKALVGETAFIRAYAYFALAQRYGGVPLIKVKQVYESDIEKLKVPRSTEKETWDYILQECDVAIGNLPDTWDGGQRRATKWVAYALKSRAALVAASIAKYWNNAPLSGDAVDKKLVGIDATEANRYYSECINASKAIMNSGKFALYKPNPANAQEAAENYRSLFENPSLAPNEAIFVKAFTQTGPQKGHNYDVRYNCNQTSNGFPSPGRMNPTLELIDSYESYLTPGQNAPVVTTLDGNVTDYTGYNKNKSYIRFDTPYDIFKDKDARLNGTAVLPGTTWKNKTIVIQGGYIKPDGTAVTDTKSSITVNGVTYYTYGASDQTQYSGFDVTGGDGGSMTRSGFSFKKFLSTNVNMSVGFDQSLTDWIDFRYAEILLNYAEAVVESGITANNSQADAAKAINDIRHRAAHTVDIPLTINNVMRERRVELAFENKRYWDLIRRREFHTIFNSTLRHALVPLLDLRVSPVKYIFVRKEMPKETPQTFLPKNYYRPIPGITTNGLIQNPQY